MSSVSFPLWTIIQNNIDILGELYVILLRFKLKRCAVTQLSSNKCIIYDMKIIFNNGPFNSP